MIHRDKRFSEFVEFLVSFVDELNLLAADGAAVLVEGQRDSRALVGLGYTGTLLTRISLSPNRVEDSIRSVRSVIILTDMDEEGKRLASKYIDFFLSRRIKTSMNERRRLRRASHGIFLHIENLSRFTPMVSEIRDLIAKMRV